MDKGLVKRSFSTVQSYVTLLSVVTTVIALYRTAVVIVLFVLGLVWASHYTYWSYILGTIFYITLWIAFAANLPYLFRFLVLIIFPIVFGSVALVFFYIIVILQLDGGALFIGATVFAGGSYGVGTVHSADEILHVLPLFDLMLLLLCGFVKDARSVTVTYYKALSDGTHRFFFTVHYFLGPLIPLAFYACFFNPFREYPTHITDIVPASIGLAIYVLAMWVLYAVMTTPTYGHFKKKPAA
jgi:hypothetical protein